MSTDLTFAVPYASDDQASHVGVAAVPRALVESLVTGSLSPRQVLRLREVITLAAQIAGDLDRIDTHCHDMARRSAATTRAVERCATDVEECVVKRAELALRFEKIAADRRHVRATSDEQAHLAHLARDLQRAELDLQRSRVDHHRRAEQDARDRTSTHRVTAETIRRADRAAAARERHAATAARIAQDVQAACVPTGPRHPYHAFAACTFLTAKRAGHTDAEALAQTREAVLDKICGPPLTSEEIASHRDAYEELRAQAASAARFRATEAACLLYDPDDDPGAAEVSA